MKVVICGAGVIGASTAYFLAERGATATLVERCDVACAASGKSGGFIARDWCDGQPQAELARASFDLHAELARTLDADYGYKRIDTLLVAGATTSGCVRASVVDAMSYNLRTIVVRDCVGDRALGPHEANLFDMEQKYADLMTSSEITAVLYERVPIETAARPK